MSEVRQIEVNSIDPRSDINVRRLGISENVQKIKSSIKQHGYWPHQPIVVRPHPNPESGYEFQHIAGQCRLRACLELGFSDIPAFVVEMSDDEAIQLSWLENEVRTELLPSDKAFWTDHFYKHYAGNGYTPSDALKRAAKYLGVTYKTVQVYWGLSALPEKAMEMVDHKLMALQS